MVLSLGQCQGQTKTQGYTLLSEGNTRELPTTLPNMSYTCIQVKTTNMQYLLHYCERAGNKQTIPTILSETCWIASRQYLPCYPKLVSSKHAISTTLPEICWAASMQYLSHHPKHVPHLYLL